MDSSLKIREWDPETEYPFVVHSWLRSYRGSRHVGAILPKDYWGVYLNTVEYCLANSTVNVVVPAEDGQDLVVGYCVASEYVPGANPSITPLLENSRRPVIHYLYVKDDFRRMGVGTELLAHTLRRTRGHGAMYTFQSPKVKYFTNRFYLTWSPRIICDATSPRHELQNSKTDSTASP